MKLYKLILSLVAFFSILNAASSSNDDDNILLLTQIDGKSHRCCISPLTSQKDGRSVGPKAEWVNARFELTDGAKTINIPGNIFCPWTLGNGGSIKCKRSSSKWNCLRVFPDISEDMRKILRMAEGDALSFELGVFSDNGALSIGSSAVMVRKSATVSVAEIRKRMSLEALMVSNLTTPKAMLFISSV